MGKVAEQAAEWMVNLALDDSHGYSQVNRWGADYDCSSAVISAYESVGVPVKSNGATFTGNMREVFLRCGFKDVKDSVNLSTGEGLEVGDVLLNIANHTAMYIGDGKVSHARSSEGNTQQGDQSGDEIRIQPYFNFPNGWDCVLRYTADDHGDYEDVLDPYWDTCNEDACEIDFNAATIEMPEVKYGDKSYTVKVAQAVLIANGYSCGVDGADGDFGYNTLYATKRYQRGHALEPDGTIGKKTWERLLKG